MIDEFGGQVDVSCRLLQHFARAIDGVAIHRNTIAIHQVYINGDFMGLRE